MDLAFLILCLILVSSLRSRVMVEPRYLKWFTKGTLFYLVGLYLQESFFLGLVPSSAGGKLGKTCTLI
jgi:hypothetical protein